MINIGFFSEMNLFENSGSVKEHIIDKIAYNKEKVIRYLEKFPYIASCPRASIDCVTGKQISPCFRVYNDGEYTWCDFLSYHIQKYNIKLPEAFIKRIEEEGEN